MALEFIKLTKGGSPVAQVGSLGFFKLGVESSGDLTFSRVLSENSWSTISAISAEISANNMTSEQVAETYGWNIGDVIDVLSSEGYIIPSYIIGVNHDELSDGSGKAGITFQTVNCLPKKYTMNSTKTNAGGWSASKMRNTTLPTIKATLPQELQDVIKFVDKKSANGGGSNYSETLSTSDDLFLLSEIEVSNSGVSSQNGANEGSVYEYWSPKGLSGRIKQYDTDSDGVADTAIEWSLRSCRNFNTGRFNSIDTSGDVYRVDANTSAGVSFAFCV